MWIGNVGGGHNSDLLIKRQIRGMKKQMWIDNVVGGHNSHLLFKRQIRDLKSKCE